MTEDDILHENGNFWVGRELGAYVVYRSGATCGIPARAFSVTRDRISRRRPTKSR